MFYFVWMSAGSLQIDDGTDAEVATAQLVYALG